LASWLPGLWRQYYSGRNRRIAGRWIIQEPQRGLHDLPGLATDIASHWNPNHTSTARTMAENRTRSWSIATRKNRRKASG